MVKIVQAITGNPVSAVLNKEYAQIKTELSQIEEFEKLLYEDTEVESEDNSKQEENVTSTTNISANAQYDFGTQNNAQNAYQEYAESGSNEASNQSEQNNTSVNENSQQPSQVVNPMVGKTEQTTTSSSPNDYYKNGKAKVTENVERYRGIVEREASKYGLQEYTDVLLALMMQESGGRLPDVMQSSESAGLRPGAITDPEKSIEQGLKHFSEVFKSAGESIPLTLQAYNFGGNFIRWLKKNGLDGYSPENAQAYSNWLKQNYGMTGDPKYVQHVLRYYEK